MASHTLSVLMDLLYPRRCSANCRERRGVRDGSQAGEEAGSAPEELGCQQMGRVCLRVLHTELEHLGVFTEFPNAGGNRMSVKNMPPSVFMEVARMYKLDSEVTNTLHLTCSWRTVVVSTLGPCREKKAGKKKSCWLISYVCHGYKKGCGPHIPTVVIDCSHCIHCDHAPSP